MEGTGKRFKGKVAVVTASTQGIGFAIAEHLGLEGASVVVSSRKKNNVEEAVEKMRAKGIDVLGMACHVSSREQRRDLIQKTVDDAAAHLSQESSIIIISSVAAYRPEASMAMYGVTKTAILGLTKALAAEMAPKTRVNTVAPGLVPTHFADFLLRNEDIKNSIEEKTLLGRLGKTTDMASAVAFLASSDASYITGETLVVSGGMPSRL